MNALHLILIQSQAEHETKEREERSMNISWLKRSATFAALALPLAFAMEARAQMPSMPSVPSVPSVPGVPSAASAASALTGSQQTAANSALCSALASHVPNPASASPSALSDPSVMSTAAASFAGSSSLPLPSATSMLQGYVAQHATDILASCAVSNATSGMTSKIPGASNLPSVPSMP
jgi:hypothetical protein